MLHFGRALSGLCCAAMMRVFDFDGGVKGWSQNAKELDTVYIHGGLMIKRLL